MKILLVWPAQQQSIAAPFMKRIQRSLGFLPPLGVLSLASWIKERTSHSVSVLDAYRAQMTHEEVIGEIKRINPDAVGISAVTHAWPDVLELAKLIKGYSSNIIVIIGGPHCALYPLESLEHDNIDYAVSGEGEIPFSLLLDRLDSGRRDTEGIPAVMRRGDARKTNFIFENLDDLPIADRSLTDWRSYCSVVSRRPPTTAIMSSRGCPFSCNFCNTAGGKRFRTFSSERILREIEHCLNLGISEFFFFDEHFACKRERVMEFCRNVKLRGWDISWDIRARVDSVDEDMLKTMAGAGCSRIQYGIEAGTERVLGILNKKITLAQAEEAVRLTKKAGIACYADFMIGSPGETVDEMLETINFARRLSLDYVHFSVLMLLPGTPFYKKALDEGVLANDVWGEFVLQPYEGFTPPYWEKELTRPELDKMLSMAMRKVCFSPGFIVRRLKSISSWGMLYRQAKAGLALLKH